MTRILLSLLLAIAPAVAVAQNTASTIQQDAQKCANALLKPDYEVFLTYTHSRIIEKMGGKEEMIVTMKRVMEEARSKGFSLVSATIGTAGKSQKIDGWLVALVPQHLVMTAPGGRLEIDSHLLGISQDGGKKWAFIDVGPMPKSQFDQLFPELADKVELPARKQPVFKKDE